MQLYSQLTASALLFLLAVLAYQDYRTEQISVPELVIGSSIGVLLRVLGAFQASADGGNGTELLLDMAAGSGIGLLLLLIGYASREAIGYGDGLLLAATGLFLGWRENLLLLIIALFLSAFCSAGLLLRKKKKRQDRIPFIPFLLGGYVALLLLR